MSGKKLYRALGLAPGASADDIKKAFRKLARQYHPDRNPDDAKAEERFKEINAAHDVLSDPKRKDLYDKYGDISLQQGFDPRRSGGFGGGFPGGGFGGGGFPGGGRPDIDDLLGSLFGAGRGRGRGGAGRGADPFSGFGAEAAKGADARAELRVDFMTAARGGQRELQLADGRRMKVRVPPGVKDGGTLRLRGKGQPSRMGGDPGDLLLTIHVDSHAFFSRQGDDLVVQLPLTVPEAIRGGRVRVPTLTGAVRVRVPSGSRSGQRLRIPGKGFATKGKGPGNLYAEIRIVPPLALDDATLEVLEAAYDEDVRGDLYAATMDAEA